MPSLKRLHAQGGSISHGQPNNEELEEEETAFFLCRDGAQFMEEQEGEEELLVSINLSGPHTL